MLFSLDPPAEITITEVSGAKHDLKNVSKISIEPRGNDLFALRVEYSSGNDNTLESILFGLIDWDEATRIKQICQTDSDNKDKLQAEGRQKTIDDY